MNKEFKQLLLKIAAIPQTDQKWMLNQLTADQQKQFKLMQGNDLLQQARRFRTISCLEIAPMASSISLPAQCHSLKKEDPFYIALILEQGQFPWNEQFLLSHEQGGEIQHFMNEELSALKSSTKLSALKQWQRQFSFEDQLVMSHG